ELKWERTAISLNVTASYDERLMKQIGDIMNKDTRPYYGAANYYFENKKDLNQALIWVNKAVEANPKAYWVLLLKAKIHRGLKDYEGAMTAAAQSMELAKADNNDTYVKNNERLIAEIKALPDYKPAPAKKKK
ncbi:MAG: tetratricopeptide repeat protein, partial [Bacteroidota bacterium]